MLMYRAYKFRLYPTLEQRVLINKTFGSSRKVKEMLKEKRLAKYIMDASFNKLCMLIEWKSKIKGKYYYKIDRYYPSRGIWSHCYYKDKEIKDLSIREYTCSKCQNRNDRDINSSINIMLEGLKLHYQN